MSGARSIRELAALLSTIGTHSRPQLFEAMQRESPEHAAVLEELVQRIPARVYRPIVELVIALTKPGFGLPGMEPPNQVARHLGTDVRSFREASRNLKILAKIVQQNPLLNRTTGEGVQLLEDRGALALEPIEAIARMLHGLGRRKNHLELQGHLLLATDEKHNVDDWKDQVKQLEEHDPLWARRAASRVLYAETHRKAPNNPEETRSNTHVDLPVLGDILPNEEVVVEEAQILPLPAESYTLEQFGATKTIPPGLIQGQSTKDLTDWLRLFVRLDPAFDKTENREILEAVYLSVYAFASITQDDWVWRLRDVSISLDEQSGRDTATYQPRTRTITLTRGPRSAWALLSELAHATDHILSGQPLMFATSIDDHPLCHFVEVARPHYRPGAEQRARELWALVEKNLFSRQLKEAFAQGPVPVEKAIEQIGEPGVPSPLFVEVVTNYSWDLKKARNRERLREAQGFSPQQGRSEIVLLTAMQRALVQRGIHLAIDPEKLKNAFVDLETEYALSPHEIFARYLNQYTRLFWADQENPFGPESLPGEISRREVVDLSKEFQDAYSRAQVMDIEALQGKTAEQSLQQQAVAIGLSAITLISSERLI